MAKYVKYKFNDLEIGLKLNGTLEKTLEDNPQVGTDYEIVEREDEELSEIERLKALVVSNSDWIVQQEFEKIMAEIGV